MYNRFVPLFPFMHKCLPTRVYTHCYVLFGIYFVSIVIILKNMHSLFFIHCLCVKDFMSVFKIMVILLETPT
jgi:hypothetical protein